MVRPDCPTAMEPITSPADPYLAPSLSLKNRSARVLWALVFSLVVSEVR